MSTISNDSNMTRLRPEGAEQDTLDQEEIKIAASNLSLNEEDNVDQGCLPFKCLGNTNNITLDSRRKPISTLAANSFWSGVSEIKDVLITGNPLLESSSNNIANNETARFYVQDPNLLTLDNRTGGVGSGSDSDPDHFFNDINTLYKRQTALFQRSCEQLKDLYHIQEDLEQVKCVEDHQADAGVSEFVLKEPGVWRENSKFNAVDDTITTNSSEDLEGTLGGSINNISDITTTTDEHKLVFERTLKRSRIAFKSKHDILKTVTGRMILLSGTHPNAFGATDLVDVEDLYSEVIYCILHMIGNDAPDESMRFQFIEHLRKAFRVDPQKHILLYEKAASRDKPMVKMNLCVLEAKELACKDWLKSVTSSEELSKGDPFVTVRLKSKPFDVKNTTCKARSIHPVWKETFILDVADYFDSKYSKEEALQVEVWNFMPDENLREKLKKINEVKDSKGLRQFIMDTVSGASGNGNGNQNKLIGSVEIPLSSVPASGLNKWWDLEKSDKKNRGKLHLLLHLSTISQRRKTMAAQHRRLLRILLAHELLRNECKPFEWRDEFAHEALHILAQHAVQGRMSRVDTAMSRWLVYAQTHGLLPLDLRVFPPILERLRTYLQACVGPSMNKDSSNSDESFMEENLFMTDLNEFNMAAEKFSSQCVLFVRKHRYYLGNNFDKYFSQLGALLKCLHILHCLKWRTRGDIVLRVESAVVSSVREWYKFVRNQFAKDLDRRMAGSQSDTEEFQRADPTDRALSRKMRNLTKLTNLLIADIKTSIATYQDLFRETLNVDYVELACKEYEKHLGPLAKNIVTTVCDRLILNQRRLKRRTRSNNVHFATVENEHQIVVVPEFDLVIGTRLFELYLSLQEFYKLVSTSSSSQRTNIPSAIITSDVANTTMSSTSTTSSTSSSGDLGPYFTWFLKAVAKWLDIALFKAVQRILKAVELDDLSKPVDDMVLHTCSAVDIRTVFGQVRTFWNQLAWPDPETAYVFVSRILDDICKASIVYAKKLVSKCSSANRTSNEDLHFNREQCHVVNNLEFVLNAIRPLPEELGVIEILTNIETIHGGLVSDACKKTINILVKNSIEILENQIMEILEDLSGHMAPKITNFLLEATPHDRSSTPVKLLRFLDTNLIFLKNWLVPENFDRVLSSVWTASSLSLAKIIEQSIADRQDVKYFSHLHHVFAVLLNFFYGGEIPEQNSSLVDIKRTLKLLQLYSASPNDLILNYYSERFKHQLEQQHPNSDRTSVYPFGSITVRAIVHETHLRIEILNARHLKPLETQRVHQTTVPSTSSTTISKLPNHPTRSTSSTTTLSRPLTSTCLSSPDYQGQDHQHEFSHKATDTLINESAWKNMGQTLEEIRTRFDSARQQLIEEAVAVTRGSTLNANLSRIGAGSNGMCNPYVSIRCVPDVDGTNFRQRGLKKVKTNVKHRTLFPLFDETFDMVLPEGTDISHTYLLFSVKDQSPVLGEGLLLGEALLPLKDIIKEDGDISLKDMSQIQLGLSRPNENKHSDLMQAMTARLTESGFREFLRKERRKMIF